MSVDDVVEVAIAAGVGGLLLGAGLVLLVRRRPIAATPAVFPLQPLESRSVDDIDGHELEPRDLIAELNSLAAEIRRQVGTLSHEMRTPLAVIAGSANAVRRALPQGTEKGRRSVDLIALSAERLVSILDDHRDQTSGLVESFIGSKTIIDVGAFVQNFIAHARIAALVSPSHPPQVLYAFTEARGLKELLNCLLVEVAPHGELVKTTLSLRQEGEWVLIGVEYNRTEANDSRPIASLPAVEFAMRSQRVRLSLMGARLRRSTNDDGTFSVTLALPVAA